MLISVLKDFAKAATHWSIGKAERSPCPVCGGQARILGDVDFNKSCEDRNSMRLPKTDTLVRYFLCAGCGFCFAPEFLQWSDDRFKKVIYNGDYVLVDPDYLGVRPQWNADFIEQHFGSVRARVTHLDYGGGNGLLSRLLCARGWRSISFDDFVEGRPQLKQLSTYDLVTTFEVFEHVADPQRLMGALSKVTHPESLIVFTTVLSDGFIAPGTGLNWWYLAPRNGHVSLYSKKSLALLLRQHGYEYYPLDDVTHVACRRMPPWSRELSIFRDI